MTGKGGGFLDAQCRHCCNPGVSSSDDAYTTCMPFFFFKIAQLLVPADRGQLTREIIEAELIDRLSDNFVSKPSIARSCNETYL